MAEKINVKQRLKAEIENSWTPEEKERYRRALANLAKTPAGQRVIAEIVISDITKKFKMVDIAELLGVSKTFAEGQDARFRTKRGLVGYIHAHGSYADRSEWRTEWTNLTTDLLSVNPEIYLPDLEAGRIGTLAELQADALEAAKNTLGNYIFTTVQAGVTTGAGTVSSANWTAGNSAAATALKTAVNYVADRGGAQAIVGRFSTLTSISDFDHGYDPAASEAIRLQGSLGTYRGVNIVYMDRVEDRDQQQLIPEGVIFVVPKKLGVVTGYVGDFKVQQNLEVNDLIFNLHIYRAVGIALLHEDRVYKLTVS